MIDTVKIYTMINKDIYNIIFNKSIIKTSYSKDTGQVFYEIINDKLEGSYSSSLSVRVGTGAKYNFVNYFYIEIEGSLHKIIKGYNALNGFYNIISVSKELINIVENNYNIKLPSLKHWFLQRVDISKCFDLEENENVKRYINNLSHCSYPRRNIKHFQDESIYISGTSTTLKIYNKLLEFKKHDYFKLAENGFHVFRFSDLIKGFVRFECEIKKRKLVDTFNKKYIRILNLNYKILENIWSEEFMKLIKMFENDIEKIKDKNSVELQLYSLYDKNLANRLYNFYLSIVCDSLESTKNRMCRATFYRYIDYLKKANIDFSQHFNLDFENNYIDFNPFEYPEVI